MRKPRNSRNRLPVFLAKSLVESATELRDRLMKAEKDWQFRLNIEELHDKVQDMLFDLDHAGEA